MANYRAALKHKLLKDFSLRLVCISMKFQTMVSGRRFDELRMPQWSLRFGTLDGFHWSPFGSTQARSARFQHRLFQHSFFALDILEMS